MDSSQLNFIMRQTVQALVMNAVSNTIAQLLSCFQEGRPYNIDIVDLSHFMVFALIACPPNNLWQMWLESTFPGYTHPSAPGTLDDATSNAISDKTAAVTQPISEKTAQVASAINDNETTKAIKRRATDGVDKVVSTANQIRKATFSEKNVAVSTDGKVDEKDASEGSDKTGEDKTAKKFNVKNTAIKFALDQTAGALFNTVLFIAGMGLLKGQSINEVLVAVQKDTLPLIFAGQKLWPAVSLLNFSVVPLEYRGLVGGIVGIFWGVYLSLFVGAKK